MSSIKGIFLSALILLMGAVLLSAQYCDSLEFKATCFEGSYNNVTHKDTLTFVATLNSIIAYNTKNPDSPVRLGRTFIDSEISLIYSYNNYLFVSGEDLGTRIYDVTDPENMILISTIGISAEDICITKGYLYLAGFRKIYIYKILDIHNPVFVKEFTVYSNYYAVRIALGGTRLYASAYYYEYGGWYDIYGGVMVVYSIADFENPKQVYLKDINPPHDISYRDGYIYIAGKDRIEIYADKSTSLPITINDRVSTLQCFGNALVTTKNNELKIYDISDKDSIVMTQYQTGSSVYQVSLDSNRLFLVGGDNFKFYSSYLYEMKLRFSLYSEKIFEKISAYDDRVYLGQLPGSIAIVKIDGDFIYSKIGTIDAGSAQRGSWRILDFEENGKYLFVLKEYSSISYYMDEIYSLLEIYDISQSSPILVKRLYQFNPCLAKIDIAGNTIFFSVLQLYKDGETTFYVCSADNFAQDSSLTKFTMSYNITDISSDEDLLFFATDNGEIVTLNTSNTKDYDPDSMEIKHTIFMTKYITKMSSDMSSVAAITNDGWLYILEYLQTSATIEIRDSVFVGTEIEYIEFLNHNIYLCCGSGGFKLFGVENGYLALLDTFDTHYKTFSSAIAKKRLYVNDPGTGLWIFHVDYEPDEIDLPNVSETRVLFDLKMLSGGLYKMKLRNFDKGDYTMEIKDVCGNTIRKEKFSVQEAVFEKDIPTENLASGVYFLLVKDDKEFISKKILRF
ncbi:MAG: hypothetical protein PHW02_09555 [bacterium]|nr:hypothetical protein [bacterium]